MNIKHVKDLVKSGASLEVIQYIMNEKNAEDFFTALSDFSAEVPNIKKNDLGKNLINQSYHYAKIEDIQNAIKPSLQKFGLVYRFNQKQRGNFVTVQCVITHKNGYSQSTTMSALIHETNALVSEQQTATTTSYLKRYTLSNALGLTIEGVDNDVNPIANQKTEKSKSISVNQVIESIDLPDEPENYGEFLEDFEANGVKLGLYIDNEDDEINGVIGGVAENWLTVSQEKNDNDLVDVEIIATESATHEEKSSLRGLISQFYDLSTAFIQSLAVNGGVIEYFKLRVTRMIANEIQEKINPNVIFLNQNETGLNV